MQSLSKYNKGNKYSLCAIDLFSKYVWVVTIKDKKGTSIVNAFKKLLSDSNRKPNKAWVHQGSEFCSNTFKLFLKLNNIEMYSTYNERKSAVAERFMRTLKNKSFKHMAVISKNVCFDVLDDIVNKYNNTVHKTIKMKPIDVTGNSYGEYNENPNKKDLKFKVGDHLEFQIIKTFYAKGYTPNLSEDVFVISEIKNTVPWTYVINHLNGAEITGSFYEKELQKTNQKQFRIEKVIRRKGDKLYIEWKGYNNRFNS